MWFFFKILQQFNLILDAFLIALDGSEMALRVLFVHACSHPATQQH